MALHHNGNHRCAIALGANLGDPVLTLEAAIEAFSRMPRTTVIARSSWYITRPVGPPQPDYINGCALIETGIEPHEVLKILLAIENQFGRVREVRWGARTLDLDLLLYDDRIITSPDLEVPHPRMCARAFVLVPLAEIAPDWMHPVSNCAIEPLRQMVNCSDVTLYQPFYSPIH